MAYFAQIENGIVVQVLSVANDHEYRGQEFLADDLGLGGLWIQTSYNTRGGVHLLGGVPLRKNYAGIGYIYDEQRDAFIPPQPFPSWILNDESCLWEPPVPMPTDGNIYFWDEATLTWALSGV